MDVKYLNLEKTLIFKISEEIDHHTTEKMRRRADYEIERHIPRKVIFDFNNVSFMDSAGIVMLLGRYKNTVMLGGKVEIVNVNKNIKKILEMSGILKIIPIREENIA